MMCPSKLFPHLLRERPLADPRSTIVATGLIALVDDCLERRWHSKYSFRLDLPIHEAADAMGPDQLIDKVFNRHVRRSHQSHQQM
jgi:hypothetical protein